MAAGGLLVAFLGGWMEVRLPLTWFPMFFGTGAFLRALFRAALRVLLLGLLTIGSRLGPNLFPGSSVA